MKLYNTFTKTKEEFIPVNEEIVGLYSCGPTVYGRPHIGNFRSFIFADILHRTLKFNGYMVNFVMNITDVGHLVGDLDEGEDKLAVQAKKEGRTAWEIASYYTDLFHNDSRAFNLLSPNFEPKATDHIKEQIDLIKELENKGYTYKISDGIYFDTSKLADYGKLAGQKGEDKLAGARVEKNAEKRNDSDFALWKFSPKNEKRHMEWDSPWGIGFPGWHIECSAMSEKYLGTPFDIHTGGIDHIPVHHTNEIAQTEAARECNLANYWLHNEFVKVDDGKMSKSLGNVYTLIDIIEHDLQGLDFRYLCLQTHYRNPLNFTWLALESASRARKNLMNKVQDLELGGKIVDSYLEEFLEAVNDDLNTSRALAVMNTLLTDERVDKKDKGETIAKFDEVFGLNLIDQIGRNDDIEISAELENLLQERKKFRDEKNWQKADELRDHFKELGFEIIDSGDEQIVKRI